MEDRQPDVYVSINGHKVAFEKTPCAKCHFRNSYVCPIGDCWNKDGKFNTYATFEQVEKYGKKEGEQAMPNNNDECKLNNRKLIAYVNEHGIKKKWLAEKVGLSYGSMFYILKGQTKLKLEDAKSIAIALNVSLDTIMD